MKKKSRDLRKSQRAKKALMMERMHQASETIRKKGREQGYQYFHYMKCDWDQLCVDHPMIDNPKKNPLLKVATE